MEITYTWKITSLKVKNEEVHSNAVVQVLWEKTGTDANGNIGTFMGSTPFTSNDVPVGDFIPVEQLSEEIVLNWIKSIVIEDYELHVNNQILKQIENAINPIVEYIFQWNQ
jgi:hypothetical protein